MEEFLIRVIPSTMSDHHPMERNIMIIGNKGSSPCRKIYIFKLNNFLLKDNEYKDISINAKNINKNSFKVLLSLDGKIKH